MSFQEKYNPEVKSFLANRVQELEGTWNEKLEIVKKEVWKKFNVILETPSGESLRSLIRKINQIQGDIKKVTDDINAKVPSKESYRVDGNFVDIPWRDTCFRFTIEQIDDFFFHFSEKGMNLTEEEMLGKFELKPEAWHALKRALRLYKKSNVISPITAERLPEEELDEKIEYATHRHIDQIKSKMVKTHEKIFKEDAKKAFKVLGNIDQFLEHLKKSVPEIDWNYTPRKRVEILNDDTLRIFITDIHIGKEGTNETEERLWMIHDQILAQPQRNVVLNNLGDLFEGLIQGGLHFGHTDEMVLKPHEQLVRAAKVFRDILVSLYENGKEVTFHTLGGNHDRLAKNHDEDIMRTGNYWFAEMLKMGLGKINVKVNCYTELINCYQSSENNYVILHRDQGLQNKRPSDFILALIERGTLDPTKYTLVLGGHSHAAELTESTRVKYIVVPSLAGSDKYSREKIVKYHRPGFLIIKENQYGLLDIEFKELP